MIGIGQVPKDNFSWMLVTMISLLFLFALAEQLLTEGHGQWVNLGIGVVLLVAVWSPSGR